MLGVLLGTSAAAHAQSGVDSSRVEDSAAESDTEIVVTGTSIRGIPPTGSGLISVSREDAKRSEEHTSELQSLMRISYAVFCLKKKTKATQTTNKQQCPE